MGCNGLVQPSNYPPSLVYTPTGQDWAGLRCAGLYWALVGCIGLWLYTPTGQDWTGLRCAGLYWALVGCIGLWWAVLGSVGLYEAEQY